MPVTLSATIEGDTELSRRLLVMSDGLNDFTVPLKSAAAEVRRSVDLNFDDTGALLNGTAWPARTKMYSWPLLEKSGKMRRAFRTSVEKDQAVIDNPTDYFKYHQSNQPRHKIPRRVMLKLDQERKEFIQKAFQAYIYKLTQGQK